MKHTHHFDAHTHNCFPEAATVDESGIPEDYDDISDSVDVLKEKLGSMKRLMELKNPGYSFANFQTRKTRAEGGTASSATGNEGLFLSWIFVTILGGVITVSAYAFFNLYNAVLKKFTSRHDEL